MGRALDILRGKIDTMPSTTPYGTTELPTRAVEWAGAASGTGGRLTDGTLRVERSRDYSASATAYRCVDTISTNLASVDLTVLQGDEANDEHDVAQLWNVSRPDAPVSARITRQVAFAQAELRGESFTYLDRGPSGEGPVRGFWPLYDEIDVLIAGDELNPHLSKLAGFVVKRNGRRYGLLPSEVLWLRYPHPTKPWGALAPWAAALGAAELDSHARAWQLGEFRNGAKPGMVIYLGHLDEKAHNAAVADYRTGVEGAHNAGKSLLVSGPQKADVSRLSLTPEEMSYLASRVANADEIMLAFGIRPDYFRGQSTYENQRAAKTSLWSDLLMAKMDVLGSEIDRQLLPIDSEQAAFDVSKIDALQENQDSIYNRLRGIAYTDTLTIDEARAQLGYEPLANGMGAMTLTAYREALKLNSAKELAADAGGDPLPRSVRRVVAHRGALRTVRTVGAPKRVERKTPSKLKPGRITSFYDTHERIGQRALSKLARKQEQIVLRKLNKLRTSETASWARHSEHSVQLDAGMGWIDRSLLDGLNVSPYTQLPMTDACDCVRISSDDLFDVGYWREQTAEATEAWMRGVWEGAGAKVADGLGVSFDVFDERVLDAMNERRVVLAEQVTETTRRVMDARLMHVVAEEGWSIDDAAEAIRGVFGDLAGYRAETIARTEVVGGFNAASNIAARASGVVESREWYTAEDERVRPSHQRMHGERVRKPDQRYSNGLLHPGDPDGDPGETINCRCVELYDVGD